MRIREQFQLENKNGEAIPLRDYEASLVAAVQTALPTREITVLEEDFWIDRLYGNEWYILKDAIDTIQEVANNKLALLQIVYFEDDGSPISSKERFHQLAVESGYMSEEEFQSLYCSDQNEDDDN